MLRDGIGRRLQIFAGVAVDIDNVALFIHQHRRRRELLQQDLIGERLQVCLTANGLRHIRLLRGDAQ